MSCQSSSWYFLSVDSKPVCWLDAVVTAPFHFKSVLVEIIYDVLLLFNCVIQRIATGSTIVDTKTCARCVACFLGNTHIFLPFCFSG